MPDPTQRLSRHRVADEPRLIGLAEDAFEDDVSRRGFLKLAGFGLSGAVLAGCQRAPVEAAIPYLVQPEELIPGKALFYASTCQACPAACGMLVKTIDGRPIKLEGNPGHPLSQGGLCAVGQASLLGLYDSHRLSQPLKAGRQVSWARLDDEVREALAAIRDRGGAVRFLTPSLVSPMLRRVVESFLDAFQDSRLVEFDPLSSAAILQAHQQTHQAAVLPHYRFDQAEVIVGFDADFLGSWISPVEFAAGYRRGRQAESGSGKFSYHAHFESRMSITGAKADERIVISPQGMKTAMGRLLSLVSRRADPGGATGPQESEVDSARLTALGNRLWDARGRSLIVCGSQDVESQLVCNGLNEILGNYGNSIVLETPSYQRRGIDRQLVDLSRELDEGSVDALFIAGANPVYGLPFGGRMGEAISRVGLVVSFAERLDETAAAATFVCPPPHALESWGDAEPVSGVLSLSQPALRPLGDTRPIIESLAGWLGDERSALTLLQDHWRTEILPWVSSRLSFQEFWDQSLHDGFAGVTRSPVAVGAFDPAAVPALPPVEEASDEALTLVAYPKVGMMAGEHAYNAWLQELPDPISKVVWGNYACLSPATADRLKLAEGDVVRISAEGADVELPVWVQPGQHDGVVAVALGYGTEASQRFAGIGPAWIEARPSVAADGRVGGNVAPLLNFEGGLLQLTGRTVDLMPTGETQPLASTQSHHWLEVPEHLRFGDPEPRPLVLETTLEAVAAGTALSRPHHPSAALWPEDHVFEEHHWGLGIDLTACTGCAACVISCQVENNVPVVGKDEVGRNREMHWIRIDRYYTGSEDSTDVAFQPMMCAQCDHAPCETVCPVLATVHSSEGLNQQIYNRCVGTRYCANNCPYKMRRFNWFEYSRQDPLADLVLNPNVTVRSRGVMEKCTFCVQRIQEARLESRRTGQPLQDGRIQPACQQSCPSKAIVFGDMNDPESEISRLRESQRAFRVLEELGVRPSVTYLALVRNRPGSSRGGQDG